jgi:dihydrofolate reductase
MRVAIVVAVARNGVIGRDGGLAWRISDDLRWFRSVTTGKPVVMGRRTFDSIGKPLPNRVNIVVSRTMDARDGVVVATSVEEALRLGAEAAAHLDADEVCVIGGGEIYAATLPLASRLYLTEVEAEVEGDTRFPATDLAGWSRRRVGGAEKSSRNEHSCGFFILDRA